MRTGWVYRSDAAPAIVQSIPSDAVPIEARRTAQVHVEQRTIEPAAPPARGWLASGLYLMMLPMTITFDIMFAPVNWMLGARSKN